MASNLHVYDKGDKFLEVVMRHYLLRALLFVFFATLLGLISEAGLSIRSGNVFIVGIFTSQFHNVTPELIKSIGYEYTRKQNRIAVAQGQLLNYKDGKPVFNVRKIFNVTTDENGYFIIRNVPDNYSYFLVGTQVKEGIPVNVNSLVMVRKNERSGKVLNMGNCNLTVSVNDKTNDKVMELQVSKNTSNISFMNYFTGRSQIGKLCRKIIDSSVSWTGKSNLTIVEPNLISITGMNDALWESIDS